MAGMTIPLENGYGGGILEPLRRGGRGGASGVVTGWGAAVNGGRGDRRGWWRSGPVEFEHELEMKIGASVVITSNLTRSRSRTE